MFRELQSHANSWYFCCHFCNIGTVTPPQGLCLEWKLLRSQNCELSGIPKEGLFGLISYLYFTNAFWASAITSRRHPVQHSPHPQRAKQGPPSPDTEFWGYTEPCIQLFFFWFLSSRWKRVDRITGSPEPMIPWFGPKKQLFWQLSLPGGNSSELWTQLPGDGICKTTKFLEWQAVL